MNTVTSAKRVLPQASCYDRLKLYAALPRQGGRTELFRFGLCQSTRQIFERQRPRDPAALNRVASQCRQGIKHFLGFNALSHNGHTAWSISRLWGLTGRHAGATGIANQVGCCSPPSSSCCSPMWQRQCGGWRGRFGPRARSGFVTGVSLGAALIAPRRRSSRLTHFYAACFNLR